MPIHHFAIRVRDIKEAQAFYLAALEPLGYKILASYREGEVLGLGATTPDFWLAGKGATEDAEKETTKSVHIAFSAESRAQVKAFHDAAVAAGGKDNGAAGLRPHYTPTYYGAFVLDPEGRNVEVVTFSES